MGGEEGGVASPSSPGASFSACPCAQEALNPARASPSRIRRPVHPGAPPSRPAPPRRYKARVLPFRNPPPAATESPWRSPLLLVANTGSLCSYAYCWRPRPRVVQADGGTGVLLRGAAPAAPVRLPRIGDKHGALSPRGGTIPGRSRHLPGRCTPTCEVCVSNEAAAGCGALEGAGAPLSIPSSPGHVCVEVTPTCRAAGRSMASATFQCKADVFLSLQRLRTVAASEPRPRHLDPA